MLSVNTGSAVPGDYTIDGVVDVRVCGLAIHL